ncbi:putative nuclease HARBI1 [Diachasma alloeum]|uniref:putative nuclease HARBI1 n=1 Tax=Diachasma alloeum TaxID=454923 RepID=UPI000738515E|nr:putative nuclease HARBI1 [Diachasma alloeum]
MRDVGQLDVPQIPLKICRTRSSINTTGLARILYENCVNEWNPTCQLKASHPRCRHRSILCTLHFLATGSYQSHVGESMDIAMSQPNVSRVIKNVTEAILQLENEFISFPRTENERRVISEGFRGMCHFPGVIGCVDGTHIPITTPSREAWSFLNHKRFHSLNVQATCDDKRCITPLEVFAGTTHDSRVWNGSQVKAEICRVNGEGLGPYYLLGDKGYPLGPCVVIPYMAPGAGSPEARFNTRHMHTRCIIECTFGNLKGKWRCLKRDRTLNYQPYKASRLLKYCVILHNILIGRRDPVYLDENFPPEVNDMARVMDDEEEGQCALDEGRALRNRIVEEFF